MFLKVLFKMNGKSKCEIKETRSNSADVNKLNKLIVQLNTQKNFFFYQYGMMRNHSLKQCSRRYV